MIFTKNLEHIDWRQLKRSFWGLLVILLTSHMQETSTDKHEITWKVFLVKRTCTFSYHSLIDTHANNMGKPTTQQVIMIVGKEHGNVKTDLSQMLMSSERRVAWIKTKSKSKSYFILLFLFYIVCLSFFLPSFLSICVSGDFRPIISELRYI